MATFYLSHWNDHQKVCVPAEIFVKLKPYHLAIVRCLYRCFQKKNSGAVLNYDDGINVALGFQAMWQALINVQQLKLPILIIASDDNIVAWHYHLRELGKAVILNSQNYNEVLENNDFSIILVPQCNLRLLQSYRENEFSFVVIEDFDSIATKILFKRLSGKFNVALTKKNFMVDRDCKVLWHILNWISPGEYGKLNDFAEFDRDHLENLRNPYDEVWYTFNYNMGNYNFEEVKDEEQEYKETLKKWAKQNNLPFENSFELKGRKRKPDSLNKNNFKKKKHLDELNDEIYSRNYHENETQLAEEMGNIKKKENLERSTDGKSIRNVTDLNYSKLIREEVEVVLDQRSSEISIFKSSDSKNKYTNMKTKSLKFFDEENRNRNNKLKQIDKTLKESTYCINATTEIVHKTFMPIKDLPKKDCKSIVTGNKISNVYKLNRPLTNPNVNFTALGNNKFHRHNYKSFQEISDQVRSINITDDCRFSKNVNVQNDIFPSLEDILTFKKKGISDELFARKQTKQITERSFNQVIPNSISALDSCNYNIEEKGIASLEEVFKCKRKLVDKSQIMPKLYPEPLVGANYNMLPIKFITRNASYENNIKKIKICEPHRIVYTHTPILSNYYKTGDFANKATQTNDELIKSEIKSNIPNEKIDIKIKISESENLKADEKKLKKVSQQAMKVGMSMDGSTESNKTYLNYEITKRNSTLAFPEYPHKNLDKVEIVKYENKEKDLLLSVVNGRFASQRKSIDEKLMYSENMTDNKSAKILKRYNSKTLLGTLFGDETECLNERVNNHASIKKNSDKGTIYGLNELKDNTDFNRNLKVRSIDQINAEISSQNNSDIYESLKMLFGDNGKDESSNNIPRSIKFKTDKHTNHKLSSLFV